MRCANALLHRSACSTWCLDLAGLANAVASIHRLGFLPNEMRGSIRKQCRAAVSVIHRGSTDVAEEDSALGLVVPAGDSITNLVTEGGSGQG